jgi:hypothetical protein
VPPPAEAVAYRCLGCEEIERREAAIPRDQHGVKVVLMPYDPNVSDPEANLFDLMAPPDPDDVVGG